MSVLSVDSAYEKSSDIKFDTLFVNYNPETLLHIAKFFESNDDSDDFDDDYIPPMDSSFISPPLAATDFGISPTPKPFTGADSPIRSTSKLGTPQHGRKRKRQ